MFYAFCELVLTWLFIDVSFDGLDPWQSLVGFNGTCLEVLMMYSVSGINWRSSTVNGRSGENL